MFNFLFYNLEGGPRPTANQAGDWQVENKQKPLSRSWPQKGVLFLYTKTAIIMQALQVIVSLTQFSWLTLYPVCFSESAHLL